MLPLEGIVMSMAARWQLLPPLLPMLATLLERMQARQRLLSGSCAREAAERAAAVRAVVPPPCSSEKRTVRTFADSCRPPVCFAPASIGTIAGGNT